MKKFPAGDFFSILLKEIMMKKVLLLVLAASFAVSSVFAAEAKVAEKAVSKKPVKKVVVEKAVKTEKIVKAEKKEGIKFGVKAGAALSTLHISGSGSAPPLKMQLGRSEGIFLLIPMGKALAFQPEVSYVHKGARLDTGGSDTHMAIMANYIDIQPLVKIRMGASNAPARFGLLVGPQLGIKTQIREQEWDSTSGGYTVATSSEAKSIDFGVVGGVGVDLKKVTIDVRYDLGLTNILDTGGIGSIMNRGFLATVGYVLN
jgi:hypothetical protein